jgi:hypothetical protein
MKRMNKLVTPPVIGSTRTAEGEEGREERGRGAGIRDKPRTEAKAHSAYSLVTKNGIRVGAGGGENKGAGEAHSRIYGVLHVDTRLGRETWRWSHRRIYKGTEA